MKNEYTVVPQWVGVASTTINTTTAGTAVTLLTIAKPSRYLSFTNTSDKPIIITLNGIELVEIPNGLSSLSFTLGASDIRLQPQTVIGAYAAVAPTAGRLSVTVL